MGERLDHASAATTTVRAGALFSPVRQHWLTVAGSAKCVTVFDPMHGCPSSTTRSVIRCLAGKQVRVKYSKTCTRQVNVGDCGPFSLAYATTVVLGEDPASFEFIPEAVRPHVAGIVRENKISRFPFLRHCMQHLAHSTVSLINYSSNRSRPTQLLLHYSLPITVH